MKRRRIIYATDFSAQSRSAYKLACRLARAWKARLLILHVNDSRLSAEEFGIPETEALEAKLREFAPSDISIDFETRVVFGEPAKSLLRISEEEDAELIVMGTRGRTGVQRALFGSVAEKVVRKAVCPVITVRQTRSEAETKESTKIRKILVPTDFSLHSYVALDFATALAQALNAGLTILSVDDSWEKETDEQHDRLWRQLKKVKPTEPDVPHGHKLLPGQPHAKIVEYANEQGYDFIVLGTHGRSGASRMLMGSVAEQVVRHADCAVITVKPSNKRKPALNV